MTSLLTPGPLRATLDVAGGPMSALTVLSAQNDPFRVDTESGHRDGSWLANALAEIGVVGQKHLRGLHYILVSADVAKPDGQPYINDDANWLFLSRAAKCARWLQYLPFDQVVDQRNDAPVVRIQKPHNPIPEIAVDFTIAVPNAEDLTPTVYLDGFLGQQPYRLILIGEKSSLREVLAPVAESRNADLYLPTGEISDTQIYGMARDAAGDGRPAVVLYFSDCDPAGWQMPISVSRKLQALIALEFGDLEVEVHRVALTPDQVREYGLPSTPLKDTERRADRWQAAMGVEQTEIDAIAALRPDDLRNMAYAAIKPFYDTGLKRRVSEVRDEWIVRAQDVVDIQGGDLESVRDDAVAAIEAKADEIKAVLDTVRIDAEQFDLPEIPELPAPVITDVAGAPLLDSRWDFTEQCRALINSKAYGETN